MVRLIRVFPRRTALTPTDEMAFIGLPTLFVPECDEVHISVSFTWDVEESKRLAEQWRMIAPVTIGGPAMGTRGEEFTPNKYVKQGAVITSRGCPNRCWFCNVWRRDGDVRELKIMDGWNVLDDNLLACSKSHIISVFDMLSRQQHKPVFTGGLEASRLEEWTAEALLRLKPLRLFFAYDTESDREPLINAKLLLKKAGFKFHPQSHVISCYVLIGHQHDSFEQADERLSFVASLGIMPFAMLYRDRRGLVNQEWRRFQREWCRPQIVATKL